MRFNPSDLKEPPQIKEGRYRFKVANAQEQMSKKDNPMIKLDLVMQVDDYKSIPIFDYLVGIPSCLFKVKAFCDSIGIDFNDGQVEVADIIGKSGEAIFIYEPSTDGRKYLKAAKYISINESPAEQPQGEEPSQIPPSSGDIPF